MNVDLRGQRAIVTGGSRGIGAAISKTLAANGADVAILYRTDEASAKGVVAEIEKAGGRASAFQVNLVHPEEIRDFFSHHGGDRIDLLVHSAALGSFKRVTELRTNQWDLTMNVNARAFHQCAVETAQRMPDGGRIVALSSLGASRVVPSYGAIGISKAALEATVRYLAVELGGRGINVNTLSAGVVEETSIHLHPEHAQMRAAALERTPAKRLASPADIAELVLFLCSPAARWIQGQTILADGGMSLLM
jgi:enoyl-[acyl-carrier protein] reductase III